MIEINNEKNSINIIGKPENYDFPSTNEILGTGTPGKFEAKGETKDKKFNKYIYTLRFFGTPDAIRRAAVMQGLSTTKDGIEITNDKAEKYDENKIFKRGESVWVRIPKANMKSTEKTKEEATAKPEAKNNVEKHGDIELRKDGVLTFYKVKKGDTISGIREKVSKIKGYEYLSRSEYSASSGRNLKGFNVPASQLKAGIEIPLPIDSKERITDQATFKSIAKKAIDFMEKDPTYGDKVKEIKKNVGKDKMAKIMVGFAQQESKLGEFELHRWEESKKDFSYGYFHILFKKDYPGAKAAKNMNMTKGTSCTPLNSCKLFIGYCCEKAKEIKKNPEFFFKIDSEKDAKTVGEKYNGSSSYGSDLWNCIKNVK